MNHPVTTGVGWHLVLMAQHEQLLDNGMLPCFGLPETLLASSRTC